MGISMTADQPPGGGPADSKELRTFGLMMGAMIALIFGLVVPWLWSFASWPLWPWAFAALFALWALIAPATLAPVYRGWMKVALVLGWINARIILALAFFGVIFPTSLLLKIFGKDPMARRLDGATESYRIARQPRDAKHMEKPY